MRIDLIITLIGWNNIRVIEKTYKIFRHACSLVINPKFTLCRLLFDLGLLVLSGTTTLNEVDSKKYLQIQRRRGHAPSCSVGAAICAVLLAGCADSRSAGPLSSSGGTHKIGRPYTINGITYVPRHEPDYNRVGLASWYGAQFHGRRTANGEVYDMNRLSAAHPTLPLPSYVRVTNLDNGIVRIVRVNDRGPFVPGRIIDLSSRAARELQFRSRGLARVRVEYVSSAPL